MGANWDEDVGEGEYPNSYYFYLPRLCNHCTKPACLAACPMKAIRKREEDGIVLVDLQKCRGIRNCIRACPYKRSILIQKGQRQRKEYPDRLKNASSAIRGLKRVFRLPAPSSVLAGQGMWDFLMTKAVMCISSLRDGRWRFL